MAKTEERFSTAVTADVIVIRNFHETFLDRVVEKRQLLLIKRKHDPDKGMWAFPGGHMEAKDENIEETAVRELKEETGISAKFLRPIGVMSQQDRMDKPCMCHVFVYSFWDDEGIVMRKAKGRDDADDATWFDVDTEVSPSSNSIDIVLTDVGKDGQTRNRMSYRTKFKMSPFGYAEEKIEWKDNETIGEKLAFDHPVFLARALMQMPQYANIGVSE